MSVDMNRDRLWRDLRLVVIDTETTGTHSDARVLAIAIYIVENAATIRSWSTLVNPAPTPIGATHIHNLDAAKLAAAPPFSKIASTVAGLLAAPDRTVYIAGHHIGFDLARLHYEFTRLDLPFPPAVMLDTTRIAPALGLGPANSSLTQFAAACGLKNPAAHEANADALVTREVLLACIERFLSEGHHDLTQFVAPFIPKHTYTPDDEPADLSDEHLKAHAEPMDTKAERIRLLDQCADWDCPILHRRMLDPVVDTKTALEIAQWGTSRLAGTTTRTTAGLLAIGAARALRQRRDLGSTFSRHMHVQHALELLDARSDWDECDTFDVCDRCASTRPGRCRFAAAPLELMNTLLYDSDRRIDHHQAHTFLYADSTRPLTKATWFHQFDNRAHTAAVHAAVTAARTLRQAGRGAEAFRVTGSLWRAGERTPTLCELHAALAEDAPTGRGVKAATTDALTICEEGLASARPGTWDKVEAKRRRLERKLDTVDKPEPVTRRNTRPTHPTRFAKP